MVILNSLIARTPHHPFVPLDWHETWKHPSTVHCAASEQRYANLNSAVRVHDDDSLHAEGSCSEVEMAVEDVLRGAPILSRTPHQVFPRGTRGTTERFGRILGEIIGKIGEISSQREPAIGTASDQSFPQKARPRSREVPVRRRRKPTSHFTGFQATAPSGSQCRPSLLSDLCRTSSSGSGTGKARSTIILDRDTDPITCTAVGKMTSWSTIRASQQHEESRGGRS